MGDSGDNHLGNITTAGGCLPEIKAVMYWTYEERRIGMEKIKNIIKGVILGAMGLRFRKVWKKENGEFQRYSF